MLWHTELCFINIKMNKLSISSARDGKKEKERGKMERNVKKATKYAANLLHKIIFFFKALFLSLTPKCSIKIAKYSKTKYEVNM